MRIQLHNNAYRFSRYGSFAWALFILTLGLSKFGETYFGASADICSVFGTCAQGSFAVGCLFVLGTGGLVSLSRTSRI